MRNLLGNFERQYRSDSNNILDSLARIEQKADYVAKRAGTSVDSVYDNLDFDPVSYQLDSKNDAWLEEAEQYVTEAIREMVVPETDRNYGRVSRLANDFLKNDNAYVSFAGSVPTPKKGDERNEIYKAIDKIFSPFIDIFINKPFRFLYKHRKGAAVAGAFLAVGTAADLSLNNGKITKKVIDYVKNAGKMPAGTAPVAVVEDEPPQADLQIDTPADKWIAGEKIVFNASGSSDDKGIVRYEWCVDREKRVMETSVLEQSFEQGYHKIDLTVYDESGKSDNKFVGMYVKEPLPEYYKQLLANPNFAKLSPDAQKFLLGLSWVKDGLDESEMKYISTIPESFSPNDRVTNTDKKEYGVEDYWEIMYKGGIKNPEDDFKILMDNYIPDHGFLTWPFFHESNSKIYKIIGHDYDFTKGYMRNLKGETATSSESSIIKVHDGHSGFDIFIPKGEPIVASADGVVYRINYKEGWGAFVRGPDGYTIIYGHMEELKVKEGQEIKRGEIIGIAGGEVDHLHFGVYKKGTVGCRYDYKEYTICDELPPFRDMTDPNSKSLWINDNLPLAFAKDGSWNVVEIGSV